MNTTNNNSLFCLTKKTNDVFCSTKDIDSCQFNLKKIYLKMKKNLFDTSTKKVDLLYQLSMKKHRFFHALKKNFLFCEKKKIDSFYALKFVVIVYPRSVLDLCGTKSRFYDAQSLTSTTC